MKRCGYYSMNWFTGSFCRLGTSLVSSWRSVYNSKHETGMSIRCRSKKIGLTHYVIAGSLCSSWSSLSISDAANCLAAGPALFGALCSGKSSSSPSSMQLFTVLMHPRCISHMSANSIRSFRNSRRCYSYWSALVTSSHQSLLRRFS